LKPRITVITLGVDDLERSLSFYRDGMGLATEGIIGAEFEHGAVAFFSTLVDRDDGSKGRAARERWLRRLHHLCHLPWALPIMTLQETLGSLGAAKDLPIVFGDGKVA